MEVSTWQITALHNIISHLRLCLYAPDNPTPFSINDSACSKILSFLFTSTAINDSSSNKLLISFTIDLINHLSSPFTVAADWGKFKTFFE